MSIKDMASCAREHRNGLSKLKDLETDLSSAAKWREDSSSPRGGVESKSNALIQRYEAVQDLYLQPCMENLLVNHIGTYEDSKTFEFPDHEENEELQEWHAQA